MQLPASNHIIGPCLYVEVDLMHPWPHLQKSVTANAVGLCFMLMHTYICQQSHVSDPYQASGLSSVLPQEAPVVMLRWHTLFFSNVADAQDRCCLAFHLFKKHFTCFGPC